MIFHSQFVVKICGFRIIKKGGYSDFSPLPKIGNKHEYADAHIPIRIQMVTLIKGCRGMHPAVIIMIKVQNLVIKQIAQADKEGQYYSIYIYAWLQGCQRTPVVFASYSGRPGDRVFQN